jgi:CarD family transcriptional regulator
MFIIGEKVVYPMHGAGIIEDIEEKKILGEIRKYYILKVPFGDMKIMIPVSNTAEVGIRGIVSEEDLCPVIEMLGQDATAMSDNWNKRYRENMEKLKTGDIYEVAEVVRNLMITDKDKRLSTGERKMLSNARQILISEMILVRGLDQQEASTLINTAVFK